MKPVQGRGCWRKELVSLSPRGWSLLSPGSWLSCPLDHGVPITWPQALLSPYPWALLSPLSWDGTEDGTLSHGQSCPCGPQAPLGCPIPCPPGAPPFAPWGPVPPVQPWVTILAGQWGPSPPCPPPSSSPPHPVSPPVMQGVAESWRGDGEQGGDKEQLMVTPRASPLIIPISP